MYSPEVIVNVVSAAIYCLVLPPCMDVFLLKLCCPLAIQNCHPAEYHIVLLEFMCVESFSAVFLLKKKSFSAEDEKKRQEPCHSNGHQGKSVVVGSSGPGSQFASAYRE